MGLDVTYYRRIKLKKECSCAELAEEQIEDYGKEAFLRDCWRGQAFDHATPENFKDGIYTFEESGSLYSGYIGHMHFRLRLLEVSTGQKLKELPGSTDSDFWALVNFADNEGVIAGEACVELDAAFKKHRGAYAKKFPNDLDHYDNWARAFDMASDNGALDFH